MRKDLESNNKRSTFAPAFERERRMRHDERGNLWEGDEVRDSKQDFNRRSRLKKTFSKLFPKRFGS